MKPVPIVPDLQNALDLFLEEIRPEPFDQVALTDLDLARLDSLVRTLLRLKCPRVEDADFPVDWDFIDRRKFQRMHYVPIPYPHRATPKQQDAILGCALTNLSIATQEAQRLLDRRRFP